MRLCQEKGISLNREKFKFCQPKAHFAGLTLTPEGYSVIFIDAIAKFPKPSSRTDLQSFFGLTNHHCAHSLALLTTFCGLQLTIKPFSKPSSHSLHAAPPVRYFDPSQETFLYTDASTLGLGSRSLLRTVLYGAWYKLDHGS